MKPRSRAMASAVAESSPPESSTTAGAASADTFRALTLLPRHVAPEVLVELDLEAHRQAILEYPIGQVVRRQLLVARRKKNRTAVGKRELAQLRTTPLVVRTIADDELHQIHGPQLRELLVAVALLLPRAWRLDVHHPDDARIDLIERHRTARLQRDSQLRIAQQCQQGHTSLLRERLAAGHTDVGSREFAYSRENPLRLPPFTPVKGVLGVAVAAAQRTAREAHEYRGKADGIGLALQRVEDLGDFEPRRTHVPDRSRSPSRAATGRECA